MDWGLIIGGTHGLVVTLTICAVLYSDYRGMQYFRGKESVLPVVFLRWSHGLIWFGLLVSIVTGTILVLPDWEQHFSQPLFLLKLWFVLVLVLNAFAIGRLMQTATTTPFTALPPAKKYILFISGALSVVGWAGAYLLGAVFL